MKKILLIAIALIAMIGTAAASDVDIDPTTIDDPLYHPLDGTLVSYQVEISGMEINNQRFIEIWNVGLTEVTLNGNGVSLTVAPGSIDNTTWTPSNEVQMFTLNVTTSSVGEVTILNNLGSDLQYPQASDTVSFSSASSSFDIPEFPTIALPIAAILGLAFIFQRRREEE